MAVPPASGVTEADVIRWVGVAVAVVGTLVAAPTGTALVWRRLADAAAKVGGKIRDAALLVFAMVLALLGLLGGKGLPPSPTRRWPVPATVRVLPPVDLGWDDKATLSVKVALLHKQIGQLLDRVDSIWQGAQEMNSAVYEALNQAGDELAAADGALTTRLDAQEQEAARVSARGVVLIGIGLVLTGIPDGLARVPVVGWLVIAAAVLLTFLLVYDVVTK